LARKSTGGGIIQPSFTFDDVNHKIKVTINGSGATSINADFVFVHEAAALNPQSQIQEDGVYKAQQLSGKNSKSFRKKLEAIEHNNEHNKKQII
jgi:hypothetical protein